MTIETPVLPESELVATTFLGLHVDGLAADQVSTNLPKNADLWTAEGFVTVLMLPTGSASIDLPRADPIMEIHTWARKANSVTPPWRKAARLNGLIRYAFEAERFPYGVTLDLGEDYAPARVLSGYLLTEPIRHLNDPSGFAHYSFDLSIHWTLVS